MADAHTWFRKSKNIALTVTATSSLLHIQNIPPNKHHQQSHVSQWAPETKKKILIGGGVAAAIIVVLVIFNMVQGMFRLDKSIYEPLDKSDIAALEKDDPQFGEFYEQCQLIIQTMNTAEFRKKYGEITYKQLREYLNYYGNKAYSDEVLDEEKKNYEKEIYIPIKPKVDALVEKWNKFVEDNDVNKYLQINAKYSKG